MIFYVSPLTMNAYDESLSASTNSTGGALGRIPEPLYPPYIEEHFVPMPSCVFVTNSNDSKQSPIAFEPYSSVDQSCPSDGVSFIDCLAGIGLWDPDANLFFDEWKKGQLAIKFVLLWPGYEHVTWEKDISIFGTNGGLITRRELALQVVTEFKQFVAKCDELNILTTNPAWRVGINGYDISNMCLSGLWSPADGVWQASVRVRTATL